MQVPTFQQSDRALWRATMLCLSWQFSNNRIIYYFNPSNHELRLTLEHENPGLFSGQLPPGTIRAGSGKGTLSQQKAVFLWAQVQMHSSRYPARL